MLALAVFVNLMLFAIVASQPFFYAFALGRASLALSAPAYIELRNALNVVMKRRVAVVHLGTLATCVAVFALSLRTSDRWLASTSAVALAALLADAAVMLRGNVPINAVIETWTPARHPADWQAVRARWMRVFAVRQVLLSVGLVSVVAGAALR
jgi:hypothetical protein